MKTSFQMYGKLKTGKLWKKLVCVYIYIFFFTNKITYERLIHNKKKRNLPSTTVSLKSKSKYCKKYLIITQSMNISNLFKSSFTVVGFMQHYLEIDILVIILIYSPKLKAIKTS